MNTRVKQGQQIRKNTQEYPKLIFISLPLLSPFPQPLADDPDPSLSLPFSQLYSQIYCQGMEHKPFTAVSLAQRDQPVLSLLAHMYQHVSDLLYKPFTAVRLTHLLHVQAYKICSGSVEVRNVKLYCGFRRRKKFPHNDF